MKDPMKTNKNRIVIITSVLCLLPIVFSFAVYNNLPEQIAVHWDSRGNPDSYLPKALAAFGLPLLFFAANILSKFWLHNDPKQSNASTIMRIIAEWLIPFMSVVIVPVTLFIAMGANIPVSVIVLVFTGIVLIMAGNYLPKSRQNYAIGIKLPWTLHNADNWNKTHRMAGWLFILGGIAMIALTFIFDSTLWGFIIIVPALLLVLPVLYSYMLYKKNGDESQQAEEQIE